MITVSGLHDHNTVFGSFTVLTVLLISAARLTRHG